MTYRVVLRARRDAVWEVYLFAGKDKLFCVPYRKESAATFFAAKLVDELLRNEHEFTWDVQDEKGRSVRNLNLVREAQRRKVRG